MVEVKLHEPLPPERVTIQEADPSLMVTDPVGVPLPGDAAATLTLTEYACPVTDGSGVSELIAVVLFDLLTVWVVLVALDVLKFPSPP